MRKRIMLLLPVLVVLTGSLLLPGCLKDHVTARYTLVTPVYELKSAVAAAINGDPGTTITQTGQVYVKGSYIYLNDPDKGIHVIDNSDPAHPVQTAFLNIPGNLNIGIRNNILYADMYSDVLAIDISNIHQTKIVGWLQGFFTSRGYNADSNHVLVSWKMKDTTVTIVPQGYSRIPYTTYYTPNGAVPGYYDYASLAAASSNSQPSVGTAGSTAVMVLVGDYLYAIPEEHSLGVVHVADSSNLTQSIISMAGYDLETVFPIRNELLLGSKEGVYVYSLSNPAQPTKDNEFTHGTACDPVIANNEYAFVTLHSGTDCGGAANELDVLEAKNWETVLPVQSYPMTSPSGLCLDGSLLFVCDKTVVKVFDITDPTALKLLSSVSVNGPNDVIAGNHVMTVVGSDGLYEFDYTDPGHIAALSYLRISNSKS